MIKTKKQMYIVVSAFAIILMLFTTTYAFFNYTRTGTANVIRTGRISFNSNQSDTINLTNVFPIDKTTIGTDTTNTDEVVITITGDTTYTDGLEYLVTATDVNNTIGSGNNQKTVPISISVTAGNLGTEDEEYFDNRENANGHLYRVLAGEVIEDNGRIAVGYIKSGATGVNGTLTIKAYLDKDKIAISDTYDGNETDNMGTTTEWVDNRTVLTTAEWNALQTNGVSFKVKVESNEGIWVEEIRTINAMNTFPTVITDEKANIKEVYFNKMGATRMQNTYDAATIKADLTYNNEGKVLAWLEENPDDNTKYDLIIASDGDTYLTTGNELFYNFQNVVEFNFENINTSRVTNMIRFFGGCSSLENIDISFFDTSNVTQMYQVFVDCTSLETVNISNLGSDNLDGVYSMFWNCTSLREIDMSNFNFGLVYTINTIGWNNNPSSLEKINMSNAKTGHINSFDGFVRDQPNLTYVNLSGIDTSNVIHMWSAFKNCPSLEEIDLSSFTTESLTGLAYIFENDVNLKTIYVSEDWDVTNVNAADLNLFTGCTSLVGGNGTTYDSTKTDKTMAVIDTPTTPGYLTLKTN